MDDICDDRGQRLLSERTPKPTERMRENYANEAEKRENKFTKAYEAFKKALVLGRQTLTSECTEDTLYELIDSVQAKHVLVLKAYDNLRAYAPHIQNINVFQRRMDSATACKNDMVSHINRRVSEIGVVDFDLQQENVTLKSLKAPYAASVYSAATRKSLESRTSRHSGKDIRLQAVEAAAQLAASQARVECLTVQEREKTRLAELEAHKSQQDLRLNQEIESQRRKLQLLEAQHEVQEISARCSVLNRVVNRLSVNR